MGGFTKIFSSIVTSTIWGEDGDTCKIWVTLLSQANAKGETDITIPGLSRMTLIPIEKCEEAMEKFQRPDKYSRSQEKEGRRIEKIDGGWLIINYKRYRDKRDADVRKEQSRQAQQRFRDNKKSANSKPIVSQNKPGSAQAEAEAEAEADNTNTIQEKKEKLGLFDDATISLIAQNEYEIYEKKGIDVNYEIEKARNWAGVNPAKKNYGRFIINWLNNAEPSKDKPKAGKFSDIETNEDGTYDL